MRYLAFVLALWPILSISASGDTHNYFRPTLWPPLPDPAHVDSSASQHTFDLLDSMFISKVRLDHARLSEVLTYLTNKTRESDPAHKGITFRFEPTPESKSNLPASLGSFSCNLENGAALIQILLWLEVQMKLQSYVSHGEIILSTDVTTQWDPAPPHRTPDGLFEQTTGACVTGYYKTGGGDTFKGAPVQRKVNSIIVPEVDFKNQDLADVLKILSQKSKYLDPNHVGVQFELNLKPVRDTIAYPIRRNVTLRLKNTSLAEILAYICESSLTGYTIENGFVTVRPELG